MNRSLPVYALAALAAVIIGILENVFFGADSGGARHVISVGFFFLTVIGAAGLIVVGAVALTRRLRAASSRA